MKNLTTHTKVLIAIVLILVVASFLVSKKTTTKHLESVSLLSEKEINNVEKIIIDMSHDDHTLRWNIFKSGETFYLTENSSISKHEVKSSSVSQFLLSLIEKKSVELISKKSSPQAFTEKTLVTLYHTNGTIITQLTFGNIDTLGFNRYIKLATESTYLVPDRYADFLKEKVSYWVDMQPFKTLMKNTTLQSVIVGSKLFVNNIETKNLFESLEKKLSSFYMLDIMSDGASYISALGLKPESHLIFKTGTNEEIEIELYRTDTTDYLVFSRQHNAYYLASEYSVRNFLSELE